MNRSIILILAISIFISCENSQVPQSTSEKPQEQKQEEDKEPSKTTRTKIKDDDRVSGFFDVQVDGKSYTSSQLQDNYCGMTFLYRGEDSFVTIRFKDVESNDAMLLTFYGDEQFMLDPSGTIEDFMYSKADNKVNLQLVPGDGKGAFSTITMVEGSLTVSDFSKGQIEATFKGKGALPKDAITQKNLVPFEGEIKLNTENVSEMGKDK